MREFDTTGWEDKGRGLWEHPTYGIVIYGVVLGAKDIVPTWTARRDRVDYATTLTDARGQVIRFLTPEAGMLALKKAHAALGPLSPDRGSWLSDD